MPIAFGLGAGPALRPPPDIAIGGGLALSQWLMLYTYLYPERFAHRVGRPYRPSRVADALSGEAQPMLASEREGRE